ncbi:MAG TPA: hypothetical protein VMM78_16250 [Thermomicrobiales bacterium]|nr:hypothetical protein [Thermomicrobiales bacterium]
MRDYVHLTGLLLEATWHAVFEVDPKPRGVTHVGTCNLIPAGLEIHDVFCNIGICNYNPDQHAVFSIVEVGPEDAGMLATISYTTTVKDGTPPGPIEDCAPYGDLYEAPSGHVCATLTWAPEEVIAAEP